MESIFEGIAATRVKLLMQWANSQWQHLENLAETLARNFPDIAPARLLAKQRQAVDFSGLFVIDGQGTVLSSTCRHRRWPEGCRSPSCMDHTSTASPARLARPVRNSTMT